MELTIPEADYTITSLLCVLVGFIRIISVTSLFYYKLGIIYIWLMGAFLTPNPSPAGNIGETLQL